MGQNLSEAVKASRALKRAIGDCRRLSGLPGFSGAAIRRSRAMLRLEALSGKPFAQPYRDLWLAQPYRDLWLAQAEIEEKAR